MSVQCNVCQEETILWGTCLQCKLRVCLNCLLKTYKEQKPPTQLFPQLKGSCPECWISFDAFILRYAADNPDLKGLLWNVNLQYIPWDNVLKMYIRSEISPKRLLDLVKLNHINFTWDSSVI